MRLETKRLILRKPRKEDWEDIVEGVGNLEVSRNLAVVPYPYDKKEAMKWIAKCIREKKTNNYIFFIELKSEEKVIGVTQIHIMEGVATTASWINKKYWRKGYSLESKVSVLDFAFKKLKLRKIESKVFVENIASNEMLKKLGFKHEGTKRQTVISKATGKIHDANIYGLLREEWLQRRSAIIEAINRLINKQQR